MLNVPDALPISLGLTAPTTAFCTAGSAVEMPTPESLTREYEENYYSEEKPTFLLHAGEDQDWAELAQNEDLSRFIIARHSGDVYLDEYREDGTSRVCDIRYSSKQKRWTCEFY